MTLPEHNTDGEVDRETAERLARARIADRESPGPCFTAKDVWLHSSRISREIAQEDMKRLREQGHVKAREVGATLAYWFPAARKGNGDRRPVGTS